MELREFIKARLADDQKIAEDASALDSDWPFGIEVEGMAEFFAANAFRQRLGPARVLRDVEAKRRILEMSRLDDNYSSAMDDVLLFLALPYAGHPDYAEHWRPRASSAPSWIPEATHG